MLGLSLTWSKITNRPPGLQNASCLPLLKSSPFTHDSLATKFPYACQVDAEPLHRYRPGGYHPIHIGDVLGEGRYHILQKLGWSGYSTVWAARDQQLSRNVAVKINTSECQSAARELRILRCLATRPDSGPQSRHTFRLYDDFQLTGPNGIHQCMVTELLGPSICDYLNERSTDTLPAAWAGHIATQLLQVVDHLHPNSIGHGDIHTRNMVFKTESWDKVSEAELLLVLGKPDVGSVRSVDGSKVDANLPRYLVWPSYLPISVPPSEFPEVRLIDFGQAFTVNDKPETLATPLPLRAPEVIFQDDWDYRVDLWAVGCTIFELFTGQPPFDTIMTTKDILIGQMIEEIGPLPERWAAKWIHNQEHDDEKYSLEGWLAELCLGEKKTQLTRDRLDSLAKVLRLLLCFEPAQRASAATVLAQQGLSEL